MTEDTPSPESSASGTNWVAIAIGVVVVVAALLIILGILNRFQSGQDSESGEISTPVAARITITEPTNDALLDVGQPITVSGFGEGLPEGNVVVEARDQVGNVLATQATTITASDAGTGGAGPWSTQITVDAPPGTVGSLFAYSASPEDGSVLAEVSVNVTYGEAIVPPQPSLTIEIPTPGETISAQEVVVVGQGTALPENNVVVRALDGNGAVLAEVPTVVNADVGGTGEWRATLQYSAPADSAGRIYAFSPSPADGSILAEASVDVQYGAVAQPNITIDIPLPGQVVDPVQVVVSGTGTALPENSLLVRALDADGAVLVEQPTTVDAELGGTGPWSVTLSVGAPGGTPGRIEASSTSPADGSVLAVYTVDVVYGAPEPSQPVVAIASPQPGEVVTPNQIVVNGTGTALPENNVVVRALGPDGAVLAEASTTANAELGGTGPWSVTLAVDVPGGTPGRIEAFSTSPADGSVLTQAAVEVSYGVADTTQPATTITSPQPDEVVNPAEIVVTGTGTALPENNVVVRALAENGDILSEQATVVNAEIGGMGPWTVTLSVDAGGNAPGSIYAFSASPDDGSVVAESSVNIVYGRERD